MGAFDWISSLVEWLARFIPRLVILNTTMGGVKFVRGKKAVPLGPGIHWYWPLLTQFVEVPILRQADDLRTQTITTADDRGIIVGGMLVYEVDDVLKLVAHTYDPTTTVIDITLTTIHDVCCRMRWDELKEGQRKGTLDTKLKNEAQRALSDFGVRVVKTMLTDLALSRVYRIVQSTSTD